jgi:hypothetical protein
MTEATASTMCEARLAVLTSDYFRPASEHLQPTSCPVETTTDIRGVIVHGFHQSQTMSTFQANQDEYCRRNLFPVEDVSLSYDSGSGNGPFGLEWILTLPSINRKASKGLPQYNGEAESDVFLLAGAEDLVPNSAPHRPYNPGRDLSAWPGISTFQIRKTNRRVGKLDGIWSEARGLQAIPI